MTDAQIFQFLGITFFSIGVGMLANPKFVKNIMSELKNSPTNMLYGGLMCIAIGFPLVSFHNIWNWDRTIIITIIGWMSLAKGIMFLMMPTSTIRFYKKTGIQRYHSYISYPVIAIGIIALYFGYFA